MPQNRDKTGRFVKGMSGNAGGRPRIPPALKDAAKSAAQSALDVVIEIMNNRTAADADRLRAASIVLDRAYGKPAQDVSATVSQSMDFVLKITGEDNADA